jgi:hypothetical protein
MTRLVQIVADPAGTDLRLRSAAADCAERLRLSVEQVPRPTSSALAGRLSLPTGAEGEQKGE